LVDAETEILWHTEVDLSGFDAAIVPGGFSYGDHVRAGAIARLSPAIAELKRFAAEGGPVLGSCNGFQILCEAGMLPGALIRNAALEYISDWVRVRVEDDGTPFTEGLKDAVLRMPIGHGEGCFVADPTALERIEQDGLVLFRYVDERGIATGDADPNGSVNNIAGLRNAAGNVVGLMPHPERCAEEILGGTDGLKMLESLVASVGDRSPLRIGSP
ncbi:MAG: phosphoribosylformylglycinamidine synthase subunit PurQ, partial [Chloroflexi bacterium]|nr:phosphoribosylformylglycinamidine synthase subunit PurQ [Chloroflexota bacterium]